MWDDPRQPPGFRGHLGESIPPLIPPGSQRRMRGRHPFLFQGGPRLSNTRFGGPGADFMHRDMEECWEEEEQDTMMPEDEPPLWRAKLNMDYRDMSYREEEVMDMRYRERNNPENEFRGHLAPDMDYREREASMLDQRGLPDVDYRCEQGADMSYRERLEPPPLFRERGGPEYRRRMLSEMNLRDALQQNRQKVESVLDILLQQQERKEQALRDREAADLTLRERSAMEYSQREVPSRFQESADRDLRFRKPDMSYRDQERGLDYRERIVIDYSHNEMAGGYHTSENSQIAPVLYKTYDSRDMEIPGSRSDADYRETEKSDSDYRGRENTDSDYRDVETVDSDYRGKKSADSDYRDQETADTSVKKSAGAAKTQEQPKTPKNPKVLQSVIAAAPDPALPSRPSTEPIIPFLSYDQLQMPKTNEALAQEQAMSAAKRDVQSEANKGSFPGKLDVDFRDRPKPEALTQEAKVRPSKIRRFSEDPKEPGPSDQDLRSKESAQGGADQDFRTGKYVRKDEDLRAGKDPASTDVLQNALLYDFLRLAAKELKQQQEKRDVDDETKGQAAALVPQKPPTARASHPAASSVKSAGAQSSVVDFLGRQDSDYRNKDFNDVDLRVGPSSNKKTREDPQPGSKDKDYRRTTLPDGATRLIWLDGFPTGASREDILSALSGARPLPQDGVSLIGYVPGYSFGSVCVEFSLVEEAVGFMEANKGVLHFKGKKVHLRYKPKSDRWICQQCKAANILSKERCWQCSALRAGSDHLTLRDAEKDAKESPLPLSRRAKKRMANQNPSNNGPDSGKRGSSPKKEENVAKASGSRIIIMKGIHVGARSMDVVTALRPYTHVSLQNLKFSKKRKCQQERSCFIVLQSTKEAVRLTTKFPHPKNPLYVGGQPVAMSIAYGSVCERLHKKAKAAATKKNWRRQVQNRFASGYPGYKSPSADGRIYDPKTNKYVTPRTSNSKNQRNKTSQKQTASRKEPASRPPRRGFTEERKKDDPRKTAGRKESASRPPRRGFTEEEDLNNDTFKRPLPLPPPVTKKVEPPAEPKDNPLIKLLGEYLDDSEEEEEEVLPPPPPPAPKPTPKPPAPSTAVVTAREELTDWKKMACLLCSRQFPNNEALIRHQKFSDLHKQNLIVQKIRKSQNKVAFLEQEEDQSIQRRLLQARRELERLERAEESAQQ